MTRAMLTVTYIYWLMYPFFLLHAELRLQPVSNANQLDTQLRPQPISTVILAAVTLRSGRSEYLFAHTSYIHLSAERNRLRPGLP